MVNDTIVGSGKFKFKVIENWENLPAGFNWKETAGVITDNNDDIYVGTKSLALSDFMINY